MDALSLGVSTKALCLRSSVKSEANKWSELMNQNKEEFFSHLLETFKIEVEEHLQSMSDKLLEMEKLKDAKKQKELLEHTFREAHSLKGAARTVNVTDIETICQSLEDVFAALSSGKTAPFPEMYDTLYNTIDSIRKIVASPDKDYGVCVAEIIGKLSGLIKSDPADPPKAKDEGTKKKIKGPLSKKMKKAEVLPPDVKAEVPFLPDQSKALEADKQEIEEVAADKTIPKGAVPHAMSGTVRISTDKLDSILLQAEEMLTVKLMIGQISADLNDLIASSEQWNKEQAKKMPDIRQLAAKGAKSNSESQVIKKVKQCGEFINWNRERARALDKTLKTLGNSIEQSQGSIKTMIDNFLKNIKTLLMLPFSSLFGIFPRMVRDIAREQEKKVELVIRGDQTTIDKRILDEMKDAFIHLLRNCIDHGIEKPDERASLGKEPQGRIEIAVSQPESSKVEILISDDGAGIDLEQIKKIALKRRHISKEKADRLSNEEALALIFQSDVSASPIVTDLSGRGLGMGIIREKIETLGGYLHIENRPGAGVSFRVILPLTLATSRGIVIETVNRKFVLPTANVKRVIRINKDEIKTVENREGILLDEKTVSLVHLGDVLELPRKNKIENDDFISAVILGFGEKNIAFAVDEVMHEQEMLVKGLGPQLVRGRNIGGATVLSSGKVVPILNVSDLIKSAIKMQSSGIKKVGEKTEKKKSSILLAEDSVTSRVLLKNILESADYDVCTANDGAEAFALLKNQSFDLLVSDIVMPRMDGFKLTSKVREDKNLSELPIVLVTSLGAKKDKERGIEAGANAYIVKSSFDQNNLLEVVGRLI